MFGTDGIRGRFGESPLTAEKIYELGQNLAKCAKKHGGAIFIGRDTRLSSDFILMQLSSGIMSLGVDVVDGGIMPTPLTAMFGQQLSECQLALIIQITASHNPFHDNGLKFMWGDGEKWLDADQRSFMSDYSAVQPVGQIVGRFFKAKETLPNLLFGCYKQDMLAGQRVVVDAANGAYSLLAEPLFRYLGADVVMIGANPDGRNINSGVGSTCPDAVRQKVLEESADMGIAVDGDGDRITMVTASGKILDGDDILWIVLNHQIQQGERVSSIVITPMSNQGLVDACSMLGIKTEMVPVGDHHILGRLKETGQRYGAEPSGHVIDRCHGKTCDGLYMAVQVMLAQRATSGTLDTMVLGNRYAQVKCQVAYAAEQKDRIRTFVDSEDWQQEGSRVSVRLSGTEPVVRIMVESSNAEKAKDVASEISKRVEAFIA